MPIALQKECECRAPPRTAATGRQTKSKLASEFGEADFAFCYHIKTSPTASGKGLRRLAQCVWMAGCDCGVVVFFGFSCDVEHVLAKIPIVDSSCGHTKSSPIGVG